MEKDNRIDFQGDTRFFSEQISQLDKEGSLNIVIAGKEVTLSLEDVEITSQDIEGWLVANSNGIISIGYYYI